MPHQQQLVQADNMFIVRIEQQKSHTIKLVVSRANI